MFNSFDTQGVPDDMAPAEVNRRLVAGERLFLLDVREPDEYAEARIAGSRLIPLGQLAQRAAEIPRDLPIIAVCRSGQRSGMAADMLRHAGFPSVVNLGGGMIAWVRSGLPYESDDA